MDRPSGFSLSARRQTSELDEDEDDFGQHQFYQGDSLQLRHQRDQPIKNSSINNNNNNSMIRQQHVGEHLNLANNEPETIQVQLNEKYFAQERRALVNFVANARQKLNSMQMFNPAKNQSVREQQENWNENEKYTLDSLNEFKSALDEQFQWSRPEDGRDVWASKLQYFLAITSYSIGLGNVIRFPILVQKNGGLAFVIPFVIMLIVEGVPLFYLELAVGQRMRKAAISCWNLVSPFAAGLGIASASVSFLVGLYYNTMVAWTLLYLWGSLSQQPLPFSKCPSTLPLNSTQQQAHNKNYSSTIHQQQQQQQLQYSSDNSSETSTCQIIGPYQQYWYEQVLDASEDVDLWSKFNWPIFLSLLLAWLISYLCLFRGLSSSKRVVYVASTFPYVILTIFFFKAINLEGMSDGVYYLFEPEWSKLADPYVWLQSAAQVFFSLGLGFGGLIALSSYNPVNNNCYKDAIKVSLINFCTSIYAGIVIFAILGYKAHISYDKCIAQRELSIEYYLSDYNLKVMDYGSVFNQVTEMDTTKDSSSPSPSPSSSSSSVSSSASSTDAARNLSSTGLTDSDADYFDSSEAIASIRSLDRQLDSYTSKGNFDYGDRDTGFIIDVSSLISPDDLNKIIENIPDLPQCSIRKELDESTQGTGLVFVVMVEAITQFKDHSSTWAILFFLMLLTLGLDSQFGNLEGLLSSLADLNFANSLKRQWLTGFICLLSTIISVIMFAHGAGSYMFAIFDEYASSFSLVLIALFELIAISHIYGLKRFCDDCELMTGKRPSFIILLSWRYISPILLLIVIIATIRQFTVSLAYQAWMGDHLETKDWPTWCITFALLLILACVIWIPLVAILSYLKIRIIPEEHLSQCWFPAEELREFHDIQEEHKVTKLERVLFGFSDDD